MAVFYRAVAVVWPERTRTLQVHLSRKNPQEILIMIQEVTDRRDTDDPDQLSKLLSYIALCHLATSCEAAQ